MALDSYSGLQTELAGWLVRNDQGSNIPTYIDLAEADINAELDIRTVETDQSLTLTAGSRTVALPTGFREALELWEVIDGERQTDGPVRTLPERLAVSSTAGRPLEWCVDGSSIAFERPSDTSRSYTLRQRGGVALSDSVTTNLVLQQFPNLYLYQSLKHAANRLRDPDLRPMVMAEAQKAMAQAKRAFTVDKGRTPLRTEVGALQWRSRYGGYSITSDT